MKNIHILPTDKPSRLHLWTDEKGIRLELCDLEYSHTRNTQNIYITSDEEIKEGDSVISSFDLWENSGNLLPIIGKIKEIQKDGYLIEYYNTYLGENSSEWEFGHSKKIILTTDPLLDGVQKIDDEFIEWFVKNPRCEWVEVKKEMYMPFDGKVPFELSLDQSLNTRPHYKIITKDYLQGFIDLHNNELEHWDAVEFLEWLKLNDFKIVKK
jgi:hypothetical protein